MAIQTVEHVQERDGDYFVGHSRVTLGSAIAAWRQGGERPESVTEAFPSLSRADAYGAIAFYLDHRQELDHLFAEQLAEFERQRAESQSAHPEFYAEMRRRIEALRASGWLRQEAHTAVGDDQPQAQAVEAPDAGTTGETSEGNSDR